MATMTAFERMNRAPYVFVRLSRDCRYGKAGAEIQFSHNRADQVVESGDGVIVIDPRPTDNIEGKAILRSPGKRAAKVRSPGKRAAKVRSPGKRAAKVAG